MKIKSKFIFFSILYFCISNSNLYATQLSDSNKEFYLYDAMTYLEKPSLYNSGLTKINVIYQQFLYNDKNHKKLPPNKKVESVFSKIEGNCQIILDIEKWPLFSMGLLNTANLQQHIDFVKYVKTLTSVDVGYYGLMPVRDYHASTSTLPYRKEWWNYKNTQLIQLSDAVDTLYPSLYAFYNKPEKWKQYAISMINEAKRVAKGKKVYIFLWPRFHDSNKKLKNSWIPTEFWRLQLETAYQYADGAVIWGGWDLNIKKKLKWNSNWPWWKETQSFIKKLNNRKKLTTKKCD